MKEEIKKAIKTAENVGPILEKTVSTLKKQVPPHKTTEKNKWIEVIPHGLVGGMIPNLCLMVFKEKEGSKRFAISLSRLQGQISVHQSMRREEPFRFISELLSTMKIKVEKCYFLKCEKGNISVQVIITGHPAVRSMNLYADDVIPFAVYSTCRFYCTEQFMIDVLDQKMEQPLKKGSMRKPLYLN